MREHTQARSKADGACLQSWHGPVYHQIRCAACRPTVRAPAFPALRKEVARRRGASPVAPGNRTDGCPSKNYRRIMRAANPGSGQRRHTHTHTLTRRCRPDPPSELAGSLRMRGRLTGLITETNIGKRRSKPSNFYSHRCPNKTVQKITPCRRAFSRKSIKMDGSMRQRLLPSGEQACLPDASGGACEIADAT